ncbi:hypothetical protein E3Q24_02124 [Wallemia mellicola]|uniref:Copper-fist domain-containing protein n=1 Tax=Wallemia mellicola TaxID=1708541 RepID=A0AB74KMB3_9BASI|nr:hypothetical protein E3Q24_02124 [Wallemia mellicola]TIC25896.1 hypothetical protein E3Q12_00702 [Wallemia mellicola]TIC71152.1 hypothetical protein E3Q03_00648 [Wallemia mellicola]
MPAMRMRVDPSTGLSTAKRTWIPRLYCALKTHHSGIEFCPSGKCIIINKTQFIEYLKEIQPVNSKSGQTSDRWDAWQRSAANYSLKVESECTCDPCNPVRCFSDLFIYTHPDIKRGQLPHPSLIKKKVPKKQQQQQARQLQGISTERKKRSYSEADTKAPFTGTYLPKSEILDHNRRKSTGILPPQPFYMPSSRYPTPSYSPIEYEAMLPTSQQQQFDNWLLSDVDIFDNSFGSVGGVGNVQNVQNVQNLQTLQTLQTLSMDNSLGLVPTDRTYGIFPNYTLDMSPHSQPQAQLPYKAYEGTMQAADAMQHLLYDESCRFFGPNTTFDSFNSNYY